MKLQDFDYHLPASLIAQEPCPERDQARMMILDRKDETLEHSVFQTLPGQMKEGDVLVINDSRVIPARLWGKRETGGKIEVLLLARRNAAASCQQTWEVLLRPAKGIRPGMKIHLSETGDSATTIDRVTEKKWLLTFTTSLAFDEFLDRTGIPPLPPYIKRDRFTGSSPADRERYQTIYAVTPGSVAAPTAGLHFSPEVMASLQDLEIPITRITLHVGYGTFNPVATAEVEEHRMEEEQYEITEEAAELINRASRVIAVGTTATRTIEGAATEGGGLIKAGRRSTDLFIYPGYRFKRVGALLTNFHLPKSTLYLLACAFAGQGFIRKAYLQAIEERYRFYSYGDCMLIL